MYLHGCPPSLIVLLRLGMYTRQVYVTDVGCLRSVDLVAILNDHVWVGVTDDTWSVKPVGWFVP